MATAIIPPATTEHSPDVPSCVRLGFGIGGVVMSVEVADTVSLRLMDDAYAPLSCPPAGARVHASLRRLSDGRLHARYGRHPLRMANASDAVPARAAYHAAREIFARFACEPEKTIAFYGALCSVDGAAVLLLGPTTIGKTLLALHMACTGAHLLGDETAILSLVNGEAYAMPRRPSLRESALTLLDTRMRENVESSSNVFPTERGRFWYALDSKTLCGMEPDARPRALRAICVLSARGDAPAMRRLDAGIGIQLLAQRAYARPTTLAQMSALRRATRHATFFEMTLGTPSDSSALLLREVRACA
jgi:hypothetical protein